MLEKYVAEQFPQHVLEFNKHIMGRFDYWYDIVRKNAYPDPNKRKNGFELLGCDFLFDEDSEFGCWKIVRIYTLVWPETLQEPFVKKIDDMLNNVLDPLIPPVNDHRKEISNFFVDAGAIDQFGPYNTRSPFSKSLNLIPTLATPTKGY